MYKYELPTSKLSKVIVLQTDRHDRNYIPRPFADSQNVVITHRLKIIYQITMRSPSNHPQIYRTV